MAASTQSTDEAVTSVWRPQPGPQTDLITCPPSIFEVFFGGARGGGKTDGMLGEWIAHASRYGANAIGLMVRRELTQLVEAIERSRVLYTPIGGRFNSAEKMWTMPNGARLRFAYLERDADADAYQGHSYTRLYFEELGTFPSPAPVLKLMATLRSGAGVPVGFRATGNPGGPGHSWVKARYISPAPAGREVLIDPKTGLKRIYIPSRVGDNKYLDDEYIARLKSSGSETLVRAWLEGDWTVIDGAFFSEWNGSHVIAPFEIPADWTRFRSMDWGYATPFAIHWWTVAGDDHELPDGRIIPRGAMICYREWYGASGPNVGVRMNADEVAVGILQRELTERINYGVLDPSAFAQQGGPSIAERINKVLYGSERPGFRPADNKRVGAIGHLGGWDQMRSRLKGGTLLFFNTAVAAIRTIPEMCHDPDRPEDLDTEQEDHAPDSVRYGCMSRPYIFTMPTPKGVPKELAYEVKNGQLVSNMSVFEWAEERRRRKRQAGYQ